jgi:hypothetical protein
LWVQIIQHFVLQSSPLSCYVVPRRVHSHWASGMYWPSYDCQSIATNCYWLVLTFCPHWEKLLRVSSRFAAPRLTAHNQFTAKICSIGLCELVFRCLTKKTCI